MTASLMAQARAASVAQHVRGGWTWFADRMLLARGAVLKRPSEISPLPQPWYPQYNPLEDSVAVKMGGEPVYYGHNVIPGLFRLKGTGLYVNEHGQLTDRGNIDGVCLGCSTRRNERGEIVGGDFRWKVRAENPNPFAARYKQAWTYCRICVTEDELESYRTWRRSQGGGAAGTPAQTKKQPKPEPAGRRLV